MYDMSCSYTSYTFQIVVKFWFLRNFHVSTNLYYLEQWYRSFLHIYSWVRFWYWIFIWSTIMTLNRCQFFIWFFATHYKLIRLQFHKICKIHDGIIFDELYCYNADIVTCWRNIFQFYSQWTSNHLIQTIWEFFHRCN